MKKNGALATGVAQKLKKEYCAEIRLQRMVLNVTYDLCCKCMEDFERFMKNDCKYQ